MQLPFHTLLTLPKRIICVFIHSFVLLTSSWSKINSAARLAVWQFVCEIWIKSPAAWLERDRSGFHGHQTSSPGSLRDSKAMMSNRSALYWLAFFFEQRRPLICNMLCSSITRRSHSHARTRSVCLSHLTHTYSTYIHTLHTYLVCVDRKLLSMWLVHRILAAFVVFSPTLSKKPGTCFFMFFFIAQTSQMDILIGTFGTVSILCWNGRQVSGWRGRGRADWCVARRA